MTKLAFAALSFVAMTALTQAGITHATPGPLLGAVAGPWGLFATVVGYGAFRIYKAKR